MLKEEPLRLVSMPAMELLSYLPWPLFPHLLNGELGPNALAVLYN